MVKVLLLLFLGAVSTLGDRACSDERKIQQHIKITKALRTVNRTIAFLQPFTRSRELGMTDPVAICFPVALEVMEILTELDIKIENQLKKESGMLKKWKELYKLLNLRCRVATQTDLLLELLAEARRNKTFDHAIRSGFIAQLEKQEDHLFEEIGKKLREQLIDAVCMFDSRNLNHFLERLNRRSINLETIFPIVMGNDKKNTTLGGTKQIYLKYDDSELYLTVPEQPSGEMGYPWGHTLELNQTEPTNGGFAFVSMPEQPEIWKFYFRSTENCYFPLSFGYDGVGLCFHHIADRCPKLWVSDYPIGLKIARTSGVDHMIIVTRNCGGLQRVGNVVIANDKAIWVSNMFVDDK